MKCAQCLYCCLVVSVMYSSVSSTPVTNEVQIQGVGVALCPERHFCFGEDGGYKDDPKCKCEPPCLKVGTCCLDYLKKHNGSLDQFLGMPRTCVNTSSELAFYLVNVCNDTWHDSSTKSLCEENVGANDILRNVPVSDANGVDYKNIYCSICNYAKKEEVVFWEIRLICDQTLSNITTFKNIGTKCLVEYNSRRSLPIPCDHSVVSSCPDSSSIPEAKHCKSYSAHVKLNGTTYKNPHCASCNNVEVKSLNCTNVEDEEGTNIFGGGFSQPKSLSVLFDFSLTGNARVSRSDYAVPEIKGSCERNEMYNPFEEKCVVLSCAKGMIFIDGECHPLTAENINTCETSSLIIDYITSENTTLFGIECLKETLDIHDQAFTIMNVSECNGGSCYHANVQILDVNSSLPEHLNDLFYITFLEKGSTGRLCNISSIDVVHLCRNVPPDTCNSTINEDEVASSIKSISRSYDIDWRYGFWYDTKRHIYSLTSNVRTCDFNVNTNLKCPFVTYPANEFREYSNKADHIVHTVSGNIYGPAEFENLNNGSILVCPNINPTSDAVNSTNRTDMKSMLTLVGTVLSLVALFLTFMCYCRFRTLRTLPGRSVMNLVMALFFSMFIFIVGTAQTKHFNLCTIVAVLQHFFWLASFFWMNVLAFDVCRTFNYNCNLPNAHRNRNTMIVYALYAWGSPAIIVGTCLAISYSPVGLELGVHYGNSDVCLLGNDTVYLIAFGGPVALTLSLNAVFFVLTVASIRKTKQVTKAVQKNKATTKSRLKELLIYAKLSTLMGMSWILGFVATITNSEVICYIFIILNSLQGVFVFIFFVCNRRVYKLIRKENGDLSSKTRSTDAKSGRPNYSDVKKISTT